MIMDGGLLASIDQLRAARVLCIGDVMLDHYVYGQSDRLSPEAPVPVLTIDSETHNLGGAGNVLRNLAALGACRQRLERRDGSVEFDAGFACNRQPGHGVRGVVRAQQMQRY